MLIALVSYVVVVFTFIAVVIVFWVVSFVCYVYVFDGVRNINGVGGVWLLCYSC